RERAANRVHGSCPDCLPAAGDRQPRFKVVGTLRVPSHYLWAAQRHTECAYYFERPATAFRGSGPAHERQGRTTVTACLPLRTDDRGMNRSTRGAEPRACSSCCSTPPSTWRTKDLTPAFGRKAG